MTGGGSAGEAPGATSEALRALAAFLPIFERPGFTAGSWQGGQEVEPRVFTMPFEAYVEEVIRFTEVAYAHGWVLPDFDWIAWGGSEEAIVLLSDPAKLAAATPRQLARLLTLIIRQDRFVEGALAAAFESGLILGIVRRAKALVEAAGRP
ncbi:MAG: DUF6508 domain-containing protein [Roseococcus sp.]